MIPPGYVQALVTYAGVKGAPGLQAIKDEFDTLFAAILGGDGKQLISSGINGKSFGWNINLNTEEKFAAFGQALRELSTDGTGAATHTYGDFSTILR